MRKYFRICKIDTQADESIGLEAEQPRWGFKLLSKKDYGVWILTIHMGIYVIELATGEGF